jgi:hypothetical protein
MFVFSFKSGSTSVLCHIVDVNDMVGCPKSGSTGVLCHIVDVNDMI